jgi:UDPglucose 6-dehydrogenase
LPGVQGTLGTVRVHVRRSRGRIRNQLVSKGTFRYLYCCAARKGIRMADNSINAVSVFGVGKLGATMVGCFATAGFDVVAVDIKEAAVRDVARGIAPVQEPGLEDLYSRNQQRLRACADTREAILSSDASFITVPTPSTPQGEFSTSIAMGIARSIGTVLREKTAYHLVVMAGTVLPGATERDILSALETSSGKVCGRDFGLCYSPAFIAIGDAIQGLVDPDLFLIGEFDQRSGDILSGIYRRQGATESRMVRMAIVNAEVTKIAVNAFVTNKISFANTLARICSRLPGGDAHAVADAMGLDSRIGRKYLTPGATFGGPCFPRDNGAFDWFARSIGEEAPLARATDEVNRNHTDFLVQTTLKAAPSARCVGLLGLSYRPRTNLMDESLGVAMARSLLGRGLAVVAYDPWVARHGITESVDGLELVDSVEACVDRSDVVVLATPHDEFAGLGCADLRRGGLHLPFVDTWAFLRDNFRDCESYVVPGICSRV